MEPSCTDSARAAYDAMANAYDDFTAYYEAENWTATILSKLQAHGVREGSMMDLACGTGKSTKPMIDRGWDVTGVDLSGEMLAVARNRVGDEVRLVRRDMVELEHLDRFDLIWSLNDSFNYLLSVEDLEAALAGMHRNLAPAGLIAFDVNTLCGFKGLYSRTEEGTRGGISFTWEGLSPEGQGPSAFWEARFETDRSPVRVHRQRHFTEAEILEALERSGFRCLDVFGWSEEDGELQQPLREDLHVKALYIAALRH